MNPTRSTALASIFLTLSVVAIPACTEGSVDEGFETSTSQWRAIDPRFGGNTPADGSIITAKVSATATGATLFQEVKMDATGLGRIREYRQYVRGWYKVNGQDFPQNTGSDKTGPPLSNQWQEDGTVGNGAYGYRSDMDDLSEYTTVAGVRSECGSIYKGKDEPGIEADEPDEVELEFHLEFRGELINPREPATNVPQRSWVVRGHARRTDAGTWEDVP
ncbi:MAG: hypothetical protein K0V04_15705 [Deltaproteobacteria bacterium]|nr:hypothetical protein [Deltaproteobacteria bacterium]